MNEQLKYKLSKIPKLPGCYLWKDKYLNIIYVGKAKNLFSRTHQYFDTDVSIKTKALVENIYDMDYITVKNENEALILENNLIKKHKPKYNVLLKENSNYPYIVLTNEKDPRLIYTRNNKMWKGKYYGPLAQNSFNKYEIFNLLNQLVPFRKCNTVPKTKCLYYDIGECVGPCINKISASTYAQLKKEVDDFFNGKTKEIIMDINRKEKIESEQMSFEQARKLLDLSTAIKDITTNIKTKVMIGSKEKTDVIGYYVQNGSISIVIHTYIDGKLLMINKQIDELYSDINETIQSYAMQYYSGAIEKPKKVYVNIEDLTILNKTIPEISFIKPSGKKFLDILQNAAINAKQNMSSNYLAFKLHKQQHTEAFEELKKVLEIDNLNLIHSFDMSNLFGDDKVGAMIALENGEFNKKLYRKFIIRTHNTMGDSQYMREVVSRQYSRMLKENQSLPNLIICDGGKIQVNETIKTLTELKLEKIIPVIGLAKNKKHKTNEMILGNGKVVELDKKSGLYSFLLNIQEEVHRFAITFYKQKSIKHKFTTVLNEIEGLGQKSIDKLLNIYGDVGAIKKASVEELSQYVNKDKAEKISRRLNN